MKLTIYQESLTGIRMFRTFFRTPEKSENIEDPSRPGVIDLKKFGSTIVRRHADLVLKSEMKSDNTSSQTKNVKKPKREYQSPLVSMRVFLVRNSR